MTTSPEGLALIKAFETFVPHVYDDARPMRGGSYPVWDGGLIKGTLTIGYGHTSAAGGPRVRIGMTLTEEEASQILARDLNRVEKDVERMVNAARQGLGRAPVAQREFDALVSFHFNCAGLYEPKGKGKPSKTCMALVNGDPDSFLARHARWIFPAWASKGLKKRRAAEAALFLGQDWRTHIP